MEQHNICRSVVPHTKDAAAAATATPTSPATAVAAAAAVADHDGIQPAAADHSSNEEKDAKHHAVIAATGAVNSQTVVKLQTFQSPASFARLQCNTDLNTPPSNWLTNSANSYGLQQALSHSTGFTSFRMAHMFPDSLGEIDVVSSAENIKKLLKLPYSAKSGISLMIHRIENTLLIDDFDIHKYLLRQVDDDWQWLKSFMCEHILSGLGDAERRLFLKDKTREALQQRSLQSKFLYHSLTDGSSTNNEASSSSGGTPAEHRLQRRVAPEQRELAGPLLPDPSADQNVPDPQSDHTFNRNVVWTFEDIRMLIGTDMPIFGSAHRPCISLRLRDMKQPINVLTGIDYWLDNLMCNVPEVVMCYHLDGLVQKYELIPTEDLPNLENSQFSPKVIRNVAQNILAFLKQNATKAGHTYWLFKGRNDDFVKLYDLTSLCMHADAEADPTKAAGPSSSPETTGASAAANNMPPKTGGKATSDAGTDNDNESTPSSKPDENPFTVPVAMLLYKVARNMKNMAQLNMSAKQAGSIKTLLNNCIQLLPKEKYPQIVTSSHYILSDLHVPAGIDPNSPDFSWSSGDDKDDVDDDDAHHDSETPSGATSADLRHSDAEENHPNRNASPPRAGNESVATKNISDTLHEFHLQPNWKHNASPPPIVGGIRERCEIALQHIVEGLGCLQYFSSTAEKLSQAKAEEQRAEQRRRIREEEQNPTMANARQAIPMPYETLRQQQQRTAEAQRADARVAIPLSWTKPVQPAAGARKSRKQRKRSENSKAVVVTAAEAVESPRALLLHGKSGVIESWHVHLKLLLLEKACLTYATLTEQAYIGEEYGHALRYIQLAMQCQLIVTKYMRSVSSQKFGLLGRAGDCYFQLAKAAASASASASGGGGAAGADRLDDDDGMRMAEMRRCFGDARAVDVAMRRELAVDLADVADAEEVARLLTEPSGSVEALMVRSCACYESALMGASSEATTSSARREFIVRLGSVRNELGVKYMHWAQQEYAKYMEEKVMAAADASTEPLYQVFIKKSYDCLVRGIGAFEEIEDNANLAILLCNMGRFMRFRAHVIMIGESDVDFALKRVFYDGAFASYQRALGILETRKHNPILWDLVNWELSTGTFTLAQHIIDNTPPTRWAEPDTEAEIIELLLRALKSCGTENGDRGRDVVYAFRRALIYQRLGEVYARSYKRSSSAPASGGGDADAGNGDNDEKDGASRRKKVLQLCRMYYEKAAKALAALELEQVPQYLRVQCDRMALQDCLAQGSVSNAVKIRHLQQSLQILQQSAPILRTVAETTTPALDDSIGLDEQLEQMMQQTQATLRTLIKLSMVQQQQQQAPQTVDAEMYKRMYSLTLRREKGTAIEVLCRLLAESS